MNKSKIIKIITLIHFVGFIVLFILFQTGEISEIKLSDGMYVQLSPNGGAIKNNKQTATDTLKKKKTTTILHSSKSAPVPINPSLFESAVMPKPKFDSLGNRLYDINEPISLYEGKGICIT